MPLYADGRYDPNAPGVPPPTMDPWQSNEERLTDLALWSAYSAPADMLRNGPLVPPRFGYDTGQPTIMDILGEDRVQRPASLDFSGTPGGYAGGTSTPSLGH